MALHWDWKEKIGEITLEQKSESGGWKQFPLSLYEGNAFLIMLSENDEDNTFQMFGFFADKAHAKNCLGLNKKGGYTENMYDRAYSRFTRLRLNKKKSRNAADLAALFAQAFNNITIEIYSEEEKHDADNG